MFRIHVVWMLKIKKMESIEKRKEEENEVQGLIISKVLHTDCST